MKALHHYIYDMKLRYKLLLSYFVLILIPMVVIFGYFQLRFVHRLESNTLDMEEIIVGQVAGNVEAYLNQAAGTADMVAQSEVLRELLTLSASKLEDNLANQRRQDEITTYLGNVRAQIDGEMIRDIRIYCEPSHPLLSEDFFAPYGIFESTEEIDTSLWYGLLQNENSPNSLVASAFYMNSWEVDHMGGVSYIKKVQYFELGERREAYAVVYFDKEYLTEILNSYGKFPHSCIYIIDDKEGIAAMAGQDEMSQYLLDYQEIGELISQEETFQKVDYGDRNAWSIYYNIGQTGWKMVFSVAEDTITRAVRIDGYLFMGVYLVIAVAVGTLVLLASHAITRRITALRNQMRLVKEGSPQTLDLAKQKDEIGELAESYNFMALQINRLLVDKVNSEKEKGRLEMDVLRAQINPHFLYNTLDMISWYAKKGDTEEVTSSIQALARFYKLSLNHGELLTTLENEILLLEKYIELQSKRILCRIELIVDVPDEMLEKKIPQFLLQPIVENSLKHGILEKEETEGYVMVSGWLEETEMVLVIADDRVGMEEEKAVGLLHLQDKRGEQEKEGHIGVWNIYRRLRLYYGEGGFSMKYSSKPGEGTSVELRLSYEMRGEAFSDEDEK